PEIPDSLACGSVFGMTGVSLVSDPRGSDTDWRIEINRRADGEDACWVDGLMAHIVVALDMGEIHRSQHAGPLLEVAGVGAQRRVVDDPPDVALEVANVDRVETNQRGEEAPVGLGGPRVHLWAHQEAAGAQALLQPVQRLEQLPHGRLVGLLR